MKKGLIFGIFLIALLITLASLASAKFPTEEEAVSTAYKCLINATNKSSLSLEEAIFSTLALGLKNHANDTFNSEKSTSESCWPNSGCTLKRTAQMDIVYSFLKRNTTAIDSWLLSKNVSATGMEWFLEIDAANQIPTSCTVREDSDSAMSNPITIGADQKISGNPGSCFTFAKDNYLLKVQDSCLDKKFEISCDEDFLTTMIYKKSGSETYYVSSESHTAVPEGTTSEGISARCFKQGTTCDYEGSLWAAAALQKTGHDVTPFMPYILALADEDQNKQYFPAAFSYLLTESSDSYNELTQSQQQNKFWRASANNSRYFDTSLAMLALQGSNAQEVSRAKDYLLEIQGNNGCWNEKNIRDTAFVLYSAWPQNGLFKDGVGTTGGGGGGGGSDGGDGSGGSHTPPVIFNPDDVQINNTNKNSECARAGYSCSSAFSCISSNGVLKGGYSCTGNLECCSVAPATVQSCNEQDGKLCSLSERCDGNSGPSSDGSCCFGSCVAIPAEDSGNECETSSYGTCKATCAEGEYDSGFSCGTPGYLCCSSSDGSNSGSKSGGIGWGWIITIIILILAIVAAIIYREQLKLWWFKMRNKGKSKSGGAGGPGRPFGGMPGMMQRSTLIPRRVPQFGGFSQRPMPSRPAATSRPINTSTPKQSEKDKEFEDTLKKLKEMSK